MEADVIPKCTIAPTYSVSFTPVGQFNDGLPFLFKIKSELCAVLFRYDLGGDMRMRYALLFCLLILTACNAPVGNPVTEFVPTPKPTLAPVNTVTAAAIPEATMTSTPEIMLGGGATVTQTPQSSNFSPILFGKNFGYTTFLLLGGVDENGWLSPDLATSVGSESVRYDIYSTNGTSQITGDAPKFSEPCRAYFVRTDANIADTGMVGVGLGWQVTQRNVEELPSENEFYQGVVSQWLTAKGMSNPIIENLRVLRVDIEGDGVDEVFISASHFNDESGHMIESGDYTVILMRKVKGNDAVTLEVVGDVYPSQELAMTFPFKYSLANFIDLNRDANLEVVIEIERWEGLGAAVYQINELERVQVLQAFCGG